MTNNNYALITGASSGLGQSFATQLAERGYNLILSARRTERLQDLKQTLTDKHPIQVEIITQDLGLTNGAQELIQKIKQSGLKISVLINNAGIGLIGPMTQTDPAKLIQMLQLNITALTELTQFFAKDMQKNSNGYILQVASIGAFQPAPLFAAYSASKAYVMSFGEALYHELKKDNVTVTTLYPGVMKTEFFDNLENKPKAFVYKTALPVAKVAHLGLKALFNRKSSVTAGVMNKINGIVIRLLPRSWAAKLAGYFTLNSFNT